MNLDAGNNIMHLEPGESPPEWGVYFHMGLIMQPLDFHNNTFTRSYYGAGFLRNYIQIVTMLLLTGEEDKGYTKRAAVI